MISYKGHTMLVLIVLGFVALQWTHGHRYGADIQACDSMKPGHGATVRQTRATPYLVETNMPGYIPCQTVPVVGQPQNCGVIVRIRPRRTNLAATFKGFLLQARSKVPGGQVMYIGEFRYMNGQPITVRANQAQMGMAQMGQMGMAQMGQMGMAQMNNRQQPIAMGQVAGPGIRNQFPGNQFPGNQFPGTQFQGNQFNQFGMNGAMNPLTQAIANVQVQRLQCQRGFTVTHTENNPKNAVQLIWYPPVGFNSPVQFVATVVQDYNTYWMGHRSMTLNARPALRMSNLAGQTSRWFSGATRATSGLVLAVSAICTLVVVLMY